jgi:hypothetical protein
VIVLGAQPESRLVVVAAHERIERAVGAQEEERELSLLALRVEAAGEPEARDGGLARTDDGRELAAAESEPFGGGEEGGSEYCVGSGRGAPDGARHQLQE